MTRYRVVRFKGAPGLVVVSHVERWDAVERVWERLTLHIPDALADEIAAALNADAERRERAR